MKSHPFHARQEAEPEVAGSKKKKKKMEKQEKWRCSVAAFRSNAGTMSTLPVNDERVQEDR